MAHIIAPGHLRRQREWSRETFGPGKRLKGVLAHLRKEVDEVEASGGLDLTEWIDLMVLAVDGAQRQGYTDAQIIEEYLAKMEENYSREWPDWRKFSEDEPIEHVRTEPATDSALGLTQEEWADDHLLRDVVDPR